jgi:hypothetical protein
MISKTEPSATLRVFIPSIKRKPSGFYWAGNPSSWITLLMLPVNDKKMQS